MNVASRLCFLSLLATGCATPYAYTFHLSNPGVHLSSDPGARDFLEDADLKSEVAVDSSGLQAILLVLTNKTDQVLQVRWNDVRLVQPSGKKSVLLPDVDLGWIPAGATQTARLVPFVLPDRGDAAAAYEGRVFELLVPMVVRREEKQYRFSLTAHVRKLK